METCAFNRAKLGVVTADLNGDNVPLEIKHVSLSMQITNGGLRYAQRWDFVKDGKRNN